MNTQKSEWQKIGFFGVVALIELAAAYLLYSFRSESGFLSDCVKCFSGLIALGGFLLVITLVITWIGCGVNAFCNGVANWVWKGAAKDLSRFRRTGRL